MKKFYKVLLEDLKGWGEEEEKFFTTLEGAESYMSEKVEKAKKLGAHDETNVTYDDRVTTAQEWNENFVKGIVLYKKSQSPQKCMSGDCYEGEKLVLKGKKWISYYDALRYQIFELEFVS